LHALGEGEGREEKETEKKKGKKKEGAIGQTSLPFALRLILEFR